MSMQGRLEGGYILPGQADVLYDYKQILAELSLKRTVILSDFIKKDPFFNEKEHSERYRNAYIAEIEEVKKVVLGQPENDCNRLKYRKKCYR